MSEAGGASRHRHRDPWITWGVRALALVAGLGAALLSEAEPTGGTAADPLWCGAALAALVLLGSRATRWTWIWLATVTALAAVGDSVALGVALGALVLAAVSSWFARRPRLLGAAICALSGAALLTLPDLGAHGVEVLVAAVAVGPAVVSGFRESPTARRRAIVRTLTVGGALVAGAVVVAGVAAALAAPSLQDGADQAESGLSSASGGDPDEAAAHFQASSAAFDEADGLLAGALTWPARAVPIAAQHVTALSEAATSGRDVAQSAGAAAEAAPYQDLRAEAGVVDLARVEAMQQPLVDATATLEGAAEGLAQARSPWLVEPVAEPLDRFAAEVDEALPDARLARDAVQVAPAMLGGEGERRYLVLFTNPAETRNLGGFIGAYGVLGAQGGALDMDVSGSFAELAAQGDPAERTIDDEEFLIRYGRYQPTRYFQNLSASPDMETTAEVSASMYEQTTGQAVDGVLVVDPLALAALLELSGPIELDGGELVLDHQNVADFLLRDQYSEFDSDAERFDRLIEVGQATFDALTAGSLPEPSEVGRVLGPAVDDKHLMFFPFEEPEQRLIDDLGALGRFGAVEGSDVLSVRTANLRANKIDSYLHRTVRYRAEVDPATGEVTSVVTVTVRNDATATDLPEYVIGPADDGDPLGTNRMYLAVFTPLEVTGATLDEEPAPLEPQEEGGLNVYTAIVDVPPGGTRTLEMRLEGRIDGMDGGYRLLLAGQPLANPDEVVVEVDTGGAPVASASGLQGGSGPLRSERVGSADVSYRVTLADP